MDNFSPNIAGPTVTFDFSGKIALYHIQRETPYINRVFTLAMYRFSQLAKEGIDASMKYYRGYADTTKRQQEIIDRLSDPLDIGIVKVSKLHMAMIHRKEEDFIAEFRDIEELVEQTGDLLLEFLFTFYACFYYSGWGGYRGYTKNEEKFNYYRQRCDMLYEKIEYRSDWERYFCAGHYLQLPAWLDRLNPQEQIDYLKKSRDELAKVPEDGEVYSKGSGSYNLGLFYRGTGHFDQAIDCFNKCLEMFKENDNFFAVWTSNELGILYNIKGEFDTAMKHFEEAYQLHYDEKNAFVAYLGRQSEYYLNLGKLDKAVEKARERVQYVEDTDLGEEGLLNQLNAKADYFSALIDAYESSDQRTYYNLARSERDELNDLYDQAIKEYPERTYLPRQKKQHNARIMQHGSIREQARAMDVLEEMLSETGSHPIRVILLELLFQDYTNTEDPSTLQQIEELMEELRRNTLREVPGAILSYISNEILLANYDYLVGGNINASLQRLIAAKEHIANRGVGNLEQRLDREIEKLEQLGRDWGQVELSMKEKLRQSSMKQYLKEAQKFAGAN